MCHYDAQGWSEDILLICEDAQLCEGQDTNNTNQVTCSSGSMRGGGGEARTDKLCEWQDNNKGNEGLLHCVAHFGRVASTFIESHFLVSPALSLRPDLQKSFLLVEAVQLDPNRE